MEFAEKLNGWDQSNLVTGYEDFNFWLLAIPVAFFVVALILPFFRKIPGALAWPSFGLLIISAFVSFTNILFVQPADKVAAADAQYVEWFQTHYDYLNLTDAEALQVKSSHGYLDEEAQRHYVFDPIDNDSSEKIVRYLTVNTDSLYLTAPQDIEEIPEDF